MDRNEFVSTLRAALTGEVSPAVVEDNVRYYQNYISQEIASGKSEKEVLEELGDPRLIARTIIDTQGNDGYGSDPTYTYYEEEPEAKKGFHAEFNDDGGIDIKYKRFNFNTWYGKLLVAVVIIHCGRHPVPGAAGFDSGGDCAASSAADHDDFRWLVKIQKLEK